jgi:hypothetical protein
MVDTSKNYKVAALHIWPGLANNKGARESLGVNEMEAEIMTKDGKGPVGGITLRQASRKYQMNLTTIWNWVKAGYIPVLVRTKSEIYISESTTKTLVDAFKKQPGRGKWTIKKIIEGMNTQNSPAN